MQEYRKRLSKRLKALKKEGETERQYSRRLGIGQSTLNRFLNCQQGASLDTLEDMCKRLKMDIIELFDDRSN